MLIVAALFITKTYFKVVVVVVFGEDIFQYQLVAVCFHNKKRLRHTPNTSKNKHAAVCTNKEITQKRTPLLSKGIEASNVINKTLKT